MDRRRAEGTQHFFAGIENAGAWCDQSSAELFLNNGEYVFSARISPAAQRPSVVLSGVSADAVHVTQLPKNLYQLFPDE